MEKEQTLETTKLLVPSIFEFICEKQFGGLDWYETRINGKYVEFSGSHCETLAKENYIEIIKKHRAIG